MSSLLLQGLYFKKDPWSDRKKDTGKNCSIYDVAFETTERIVEERVVQNGDILQMSELTQIFKNHWKKVEKLMLVIKTRN